jgi:putative addiction module CopG family antidote
MKISLSPDVERLIAEKLNSGRYRSADEVVREGLDLLQEREEAEQLSPSLHATTPAEAFETIAKGVPDAEWERLPSDLSRNLDHYLYGKQKTS